MAILSFFMKPFHDGIVTTDCPDPFESPNLQKARITMISLSKSYYPTCPTSFECVKIKVLESFKVSKFQNFEFQMYLLGKFQSFKVSKCVGEKFESFKVSKFQIFESFKVSKFLILKVSKFQNFKLPNWGDGGRGGGGDLKL